LLSQYFPLTPVGSPRTIPIPNRPFAGDTAAASALELEELIGKSLFRALTPCAETIVTKRSEMQRSERITSRFFSIVISPSQEM
jgi:hypothetical protein